MKEATHLILTLVSTGSNYRQCQRKQDQDFSGTT